MSVARGAAGPQGGAGAAPVRSPGGEANGDRTASTRGGIAVVGLDCRFPGAPDPAAYWDLLSGGGDAVGRRPAARRTWGSSRQGPSPGGRQGGFVSDAEKFDHAFFRINRAEAAAMDPQQRLLLQTVWRAIEDSGTAPGGLAGSTTGVYVGCMADDWARLQLGLEEVTPRTGTGTGRSMLANRIAYQLDLRGPCLTVDTACSSSLVALHLAAGALRDEECGTAVVGGVNLVITTVLDEIYEQSGLSAPDGRCKPFSAGADGIGRSDGVGAVVLRRLEDAVRDGQRVYAVIRGSAVNQDGRSNGIMAPSRGAQRQVIEAACRRAGVEPAEVGWVEAHGTGTALGDLIEARALGDVYGGGRERPCAIGSVKGNVGHAEGAAGMAGLIKAALALHHGVVPPSRYADDVSPQLDLEGHGLTLLREPLDLSGGPVLAGLSSFGMGGSNAHVVLATAPAPAAGDTGGDPLPGVFTLTSDSAPGLRRNLKAQADALAAAPEQRVAPVCWTSNRVRTGLAHRAALPVGGTAELVAALRAAAEADDGVPAPDEPPSVAFLFTGQGAQSPGMTARLYRESPVYRRYLDEAAAELRPFTRVDMAEVIVGGDPRVHQTGFTQPAMFAVQYALARTLGELGIVPGAVLGHSIGEFAAAVAAGALTLDEAARLVSVRGAFMQALPSGGGMLATRARPEDVQELVDAERRVGIGAVNGTSATVLSGDIEALDRLGTVLRERGVQTTPLRVSHAFHSPLMAPMLTRFGRVAVRVPGRVPQLPFFSTVRGRLLCGEPLDGPYWTEHISATVRFAETATALVGQGYTHLVEIGPQPVLSRLVRHLGAPAAGVTCLNPVRNDGSGLRELGQVAAALYEAGLDVSFGPLYREEDRVLRRLPGQVFSTAAGFWHTAPAPAARPSADPAREGGAADAGGPAALRPEAVPQATGDDVVPAVRATVAGILGTPEHEIQDDLRFYDDLGFDSVMFMELKYRLEERLPVLGELSIPEMMSSLVTIESLVEYLRGQLTSVAA